MRAKKIYEIEHEFALYQERKRMRFDVAASDEQVNIASVQLSFNRRSGHQINANNIALEVELSPQFMPGLTRGNHRSYDIVSEWNGLARGCDRVESTAGNNFLIHIPLFADAGSPLISVIYLLHSIQTWKTKKSLISDIASETNVPFVFPQEHCTAVTEMAKSQWKRIVGNKIG